MKKLALTNLLLLTAHKSVSACSYLAGFKKSFPETMLVVDFYSGIYFLLSLSLILANFAIFYLRKQRDYLFLFLLIPTIVIWILLALFGVLLEECSFQINTLKWGLIVFLPFFVIQIGLWITKSGFHLPVKKHLSITSIKPN